MEAVTTIVPGCFCNGFPINGAIRRLKRAEDLASKTKLGVEIASTSGPPFLFSRQFFSIVMISRLSL
jgi:hypothetical protein